MATFHYVYILASISNPNRHYTGPTDDLTNRLSSHNAGQIRHTSKNRPWRVETTMAFRNNKKARAFEAYLKTHSGREFTSRHF